MRQSNMKAPGKVYIDDFGSGFSHGWHTEHCYEKDIEYVRKDIFIEKTIEFIQKHTSEIYSDYQMDKEYWIEDFKKYMENKV